MYDALGVTLTEMGESYYNNMIPGTIDILRQVYTVCEYECLYLFELCILVMMPRNLTSSGQNTARRICRSIR